VKLGFARFAVAALMRRDLWSGLVATTLPGLSVYQSPLGAVSSSTRPATTQSFGTVTTYRERWRLSNRPKRRA